MSRRYASIKLLVGFCLFWSIGGTELTSAQAVLTVPSGVNGVVGSTLPIEFTITNLPDSGIATFKITLDYQPEVLQFNENSLLSTGTLSDTWSVNINPMEDGRVIVGGFAIGSDYITSEGTLVTLVASLEAEGETDLVIDSLGTDIEDPTGMLVNTQLVDGTLRVLREQNTPPEFITVLEDQEITSASIPFMFTYEATDADGDSLTFFIQDAPEGAALDSGGTFTFNPPAIVLDDYVITTLVSDGIDTTQTVATLTLVSGVKNEESPSAVQYTLYPHFPNPVVSSSTLRYSIPEYGPVRLAVYDLLGREVRVLVDEVRATGMHDVQFPAHDLPSGTYFYRLDTEGGVFTRSLMIIR